MNELYWITRIAAFNEAVSAIGLVAGLVGAYVIFRHAMGLSDYDSEEKKAKNTKMLRYSVIVAVISLVLGVFIPTKQDLLFIFGVGTVYDAVKDSPTAKQIPEDALKALDLWLKDSSEESK